MARRLTVDEHRAIGNQLQDQFNYAVGLLTLVTETYGSRSSPATFADRAARRTRSLQEALDRQYKRDWPASYDPEVYSLAADK